MPTDDIRFTVSLILTLILIFTGQKLFSVALEVGLVKDVFEIGNDLHISMQEREGLLGQAYNVWYSFYIKKKLKEKLQYLGPRKIQMSIIFWFLMHVNKIIIL